MAVPASASPVKGAPAPVRAAALTCSFIAVAVVPSTGIVIV
ncbi:hypothetical protein [Acrocarpospora pleiomorpha]|nr:hypothetical protein [Acrocarpospora pleiomorpha]